jgi:hypothetical protein
MVVAVKVDVAVGHRHLHRRVAVGSGCGRRKRDRHVGVGGQPLAEADEIEEPEVDDIVSVEGALLKRDLVAVVGALVRVRILEDALVVLVTAPEAAGGERPTNEARPPGVSGRLPSGGTRGVSILARDIRRRYEARDLRSDRRRRLAELLFSALVGDGAGGLDVVRRCLDLLVCGVVGQTRHPGKHDRKSFLVKLLAAAE